MQANNRDPTGESVGLNGLRVSLRLILIQLQSSPSWQEQTGRNGSMRPLTKKQQLQSVLQRREPEQEYIRTY